MEGIPTDSWLATNLSGTPVLEAEPGRPWALGVGGPRSFPDIGRALEATRAKLELAYSRLQPKLQQKRFQVSGCGWQWKLRGQRFRARPILFVIENGLALSKRREFSLTLEPRYWHLDGGRLGRLNDIPNGQLSETELQAIAHQMERDNRGQHPTSTIDILVEAIREASQSRPEVGADCMVVYMPMPSHRRVEAAYVPAITDNRGSEPCYSPWVISQYTQSAPCELIGDWQVGLGRFTVSLHGAPAQTGWPPGFPDPPEELKQLSPNWRGWRMVRFGSQKRRAPR